MNKKRLVQPFAAAIGVTVFATLAGVALAAEQPFAQSGLTAGYAVAAADEGSAMSGTTGTSQPNAATPGTMAPKKKHHKHAANAKKPAMGSDAAGKMAKPDGSAEQ